MLESVSLHFASSAVFSIQELEQFESFLSPQELGYVQAARDEGLRKTRLVAHGLLRQLLAERVGVGAAEMVIEKTETGKPFLAGERKDKPHFSLAYSQRWILIAISDLLDLGVDLEFINADVVTDQLVNDVTTEEEQLTVSALNGKERVQRFFELWVEKESLLKATGEGLGGLKNILSGEFDRSSYRGKSWQTILLPAPEQYVVAISFACESAVSFRDDCGEAISCDFA